MNVAVVTDSTGYLPDGLASARGVVVVPLRVTLGERVGRDDGAAPQDREGVGGNLGTVESHP